jgi:topoisomerase IV subunit A
MALSEVGEMSRARRGLLVLRELKRDPHRIVVMMSVDDATRLNVLTDTGKVTTLNPAQHPAGDRYSNGSFVIDTDVLGKPVFVQTKEEPADQVE